MKNWLTKKLTALLFISTFTLGAFGVFVNTAYANPHTPPFINDILEDYWLLLPAGTLLYDTRELDDGLYVNTYEGTPPVAKYELDYPVDQSQVDKILANIASDGAVVSGLQKYNSTLRTWEDANDECTYYSPLGSCRAAIIENEERAQELSEALYTAQYALDAALETLSVAVPAARERQQSLIDSFVAKNEANALYMQTANSITGGETSAQSALAEQESSIIQGQAPVTGVPLSEEERQALRQQQQDIVDKLTDDRLNDKMHDACSFGIPSALGGNGKPMNITPCIANVVYSIIYKPTMYALMGSGYIFDQVLNLSIDSKFVNQPFVNTLWTVIRDFANMLFIFILLYTGIMTIFGETNWRKTILQVIFIALIINFSLFFTKVIIDAGNILAVGVKSAIASGGSISEGLVAGFQPQKFVSYTSQGDASGGDAIIIFLISALVTGFAAYIFFMAAILFTRRLIVFWALMILSPFAFISTAIPGKSGEFHKWLGTLVSQAFVAPVFLFFIYMIMIGISSGILDSLTIPGSGWFVTLLVPVMISMLLIKALQEALKFTENMAGSTGSMVSGLVSGAIGIAGGAALGAATGGTALLGRSVGGRLAQNLQDRGTFSKMATNENNAFSRFAGRQLIGLNEKARTGTWDIAGTKVGKATLGKAASSIGIKMEGPGEGAKGGYEGMMKRQDQADLKFAKKLEMTESEKATILGDTAEKVEKSQKGLEEKKKEIAKLTEQIAAAQKAQDENPEIKEAKAQYEQAVKGGNSELIEAAKDTLEKAETAHSNMQPDTIKLSTLKKKLEETKEQETAADAELAELKSVAKTATEKVKEEEDRRRESYAKYVEERGKIIGAAGGVAGTIAGAAGIAAAGPLGAAAYVAGMGGVVGGYSNEQARKTAAKLRKGGDSSKPAEEKKDIEKVIDELVKKKIEADKKSSAH